MFKRLMLVTLTAGLVGAQLTADAFCASCHRMRKHATHKSVVKKAVKKAVRKHAVKHAAKKTVRHHGCSSCHGGVCHLRKHVNAQPKKSVTQPVKAKAHTARKHHGCSSCHGGCCNR